MVDKPSFIVGAPLHAKRGVGAPATPPSPASPPPTPPKPPKAKPEKKPRQKSASMPRFGVRNLRSLSALNDKLANFILPFTSEDTRTPDSMARPMILMGSWLMIILFGFIGAWAAFVPLDTGAVAIGKVVVDSNSKVIQHLEGGIIKEILVKEGQRVKAGDVLVRLDSTNAEARNEQLRGQWLTAKATEARLLAERDALDSVTFPEEITKLESTDDKIAKGLDAQRRLFVTRRENMQGEEDVMRQKMRQSEEEINGLREQISSASQQISLLNEEIAVVKQLLEKGNAVKPRLLALQRQAAELQGRRGQAQSMISRANQTISEAKIAIVNQRTEFLNSVVNELKDTQLQLSNLDEQMRSSADIVRRIEITAPIAGQVTGLKIFTIGGVIQPGDTLMSIVPIGEKLVVDAHISPTDIDIVRAGLQASVKISVVDSRRMRPLLGKVVTVSADRFDNPQMGESFYVARVEIPPEELASKLDGFELTAGMPAEVLIVTGERTMLSYLTRPIRESFGRAFRQE
jgi:epimerase transport system membrane fusion protein